MHTNTTVRLGLDRWRILDTNGSVVGLVEEVHDASGAAYRASRFRWATSTFTAIGTFWSLAEAAAVLRLP